MLKFRRKKIAEGLVKLIEDNDEYTVAQLLCTILRNKNNNVEKMYDMTDENFSAALQDTLLELEETELEQTITEEELKEIIKTK